MQKSFFLIAILFSGIVSLGSMVTADRNSNYWIRYSDEQGRHGYLNSNGDTMIPAGQYFACFTDTFRSYALVWDTARGIIGINREKKMLYSVFVYDNGPDPVSEGKFRIVRNNLIGFADERTGKVMIYPQYKCATPYENSVSSVSFNCDVKITDGEHVSWTGGDWFYIDHSGRKAAPPEH